MPEQLAAADESFGREVDELAGVDDDAAITRARRL
jgi:hypothetical protein